MYIRSKRILWATLTVFVLSIAVPSPTQAFFNRDCANLKKRVNTNQIKYEKAWDKYQTALGKYQAIKDPPYGADQEVANRLRVTYSTIEVMLIDMAKFPKCLVQSITVVNKNISDLKKWKTEYVSFRYGAPMPEIFNFRTYLK